MTYTKKTKIIATVGPASNDKITLMKLVEAGADIFRLNFSHGDFKDHKNVIEAIREINKEKDLNICILQDLQGPKIRIGEVKDGVEVKEGDVITISTTFEGIGDAKLVGTTFKEIVKDAQVGELLLIDDGKLHLKVQKIEKRPGSRPSNIWGPTKV